MIIEWSFSEYQQLQRYFGIAIGLTASLNAVATHGWVSLDGIVFYTG